MVDIPGFLDSLGNLPVCACRQCSDVTERIDVKSKFGAPLIKLSDSVVTSLKTIDGKLKFRDPLTNCSVGTCYRLQKRIFIGCRKSVI